MYIYKFSTEKEEIQKICQEALDSKLFHEGFSMEMDYLYAISGGVAWYELNLLCIGICYNAKGRAVGCCYLKKDFFHPVPIIACYVLPKYRRNGIAKTISNGLLKETGFKEYEADRRGVSGEAYKFFNTLEIVPKYV